MLASVAQFFDEFDDVSERIVRARHQDFPKLLRRWFATMDEAPKQVSDRVRWLKTLVSWDDVRANVLRPIEGMGAGEMEWPDDRENRLSGQLALLGHLAAGTADDAWGFAHEYFYTSSNKLDDILHELTEHLFDDHRSELRRYIEWNLETPVPEGRAVPAADRLVPINHNSDIYQQVINSADKLQAALAGFNGLEVETAERVDAEISAGKVLLKSHWVRVAALTAVVVPTLKWLLETFAGTAVGMAAQALLDHLVALVPTLL